jgi:hypothetical protein
MSNKTFNIPAAKLQYDRVKAQSMFELPRATESGRKNPTRVVSVSDAIETEGEKEVFTKGRANESSRNNPARVVSVSDASATEGEKEVFTVGLSNITKSPTTVSLKLAGETATVDKDFSRQLETSFDGGKTWKSVASNGQLEVGVGVKDFHVRTQTLADKLVEGTETFKLNASNRGGSASGTGKILDATAPVAAKPVAAPITPAAPALSPEAKAITDKGASNIHIDIDGDGLNTTDIKNGVKFDILNNGTPIGTGWGNADDSLLVFDRNGNGKIDNGSELFGGGVGQGFAKLAALDTNKDGILDAKDTDFGKLQVWNDRNQNGVTDPGELKSLKDVNIASLNLGYTNDFKTPNNGNLFGETSTAKTLNGEPAFSMVEVYYPIA